jgi:signal peptidase I
LEQSEFPQVDEQPRDDREQPAPAAVAPAGSSRVAARLRAALLTVQPFTWREVGEELLLWGKTFASAGVYATLIVTFVCQVARVEGQSMEPTLENQDRLVVNKLIYRISAPRRNDIVMLYYPLDPDNKPLVKRIIGEPGDDVYVTDGRVFVNGIQLKDDFIPPTLRSHDEFGPIHLRDGSYFVMGDHRNNSSDSRIWGEVPTKYIIGRVQLRWWPLDTARLFQ